MPSSADADFLNEVEGLGGALSCGAHKASKSQYRQFSAAMSSGGGYVKLFRAAIYAALEHDSLTVAQATALSPWSRFRQLIVSAAIVALLPDTLPFRFQMAMFFDRVLPSNVSPLLESCFRSDAHKPADRPCADRLGRRQHHRRDDGDVDGRLSPGHNLHSEAAGFWAASPAGAGTGPLSLVPMCAASALVVFGHIITQWMANHFAVEARTPFYVVALVVHGASPWRVASASSRRLSPRYRRQQTYARAHGTVPRLPYGLELAQQSSGHHARHCDVVRHHAGIWIYYVTRFANYSRVYGSLGAAIALMFWLT